MGIDESQLNVSIRNFVSAFRPAAAATIPKRAVPGFDTTMHVDARGHVSCGAT
jgi:hypothetical protein